MQEVEDEYKQHKTQNSPFFYIINSYRDFVFNMIMSRECSVSGLFRWNERKNNNEIMTCRFVFTIWQQIHLTQVG